MDHSEGFKQVVATIKTLETQISHCQNAILLCETSAQEAGKEIDEHFALLANALALRKAELLAEVEQKASTQKKLLVATQNQLEISKKFCAQILEASSVIYTVHKKAAETVWNSIESIKFPCAVEKVIKPSFAKKLLHKIQTYGTVNYHGTWQGKLETFVVRPWGFGRQETAEQSNTICVNTHDECVYVSDFHTGKIKKITLQGIESTFSKDTKPLGIAHSANENTFFVISPKWNLYHIAQISPSETKTICTRQSPINGIAADIDTNTIYITMNDFCLFQICRITPQGEISILADVKLGTDPKFSTLKGIFFDKKANYLLVCDFGYGYIRKVSLDGEVSALCRVPQPTNVIVTDSGSIIVSSSNNRLYMLVQQGEDYEAVVLAGSGEKGGANGNLFECGFDHITGLAMHEPSHTLFVAEQSGRVQKITFDHPL